MALVECVWFSDRRNHRFAREQAGITTFFPANTESRSQRRSADLDSIYLQILRVSYQLATTLPHLNRIFPLPADDPDGFLTPPPDTYSLRFLLSFYRSIYLMFAIILRSCYQ